jgi:histidyl-tRNA synthetase
MSGDRRAIERVRGTQDFWPRDARQLDEIRRRLEAVFGSFGYQRVEVPVLEPAELHLRKSGLEIVSKLYAFGDQGGRQLCLRPELTASLARAYVAQPASRLPVKTFCTGPVFRYERPARGRYRQFTQSGVELIGAPGAAADSEVVFLAMHGLERLGLRELTVTLGHVGILGDLLTKLGLSGRLRTFLLDSVEEVRRRGVDRVRDRLQELDPELFDPPFAPVPGATAGVAVSPNGHDGRQPPIAQGGDDVPTVVQRLLAATGSAGLGRREVADVAERLRSKLEPHTNREAVERALAFIAELGAIRGTPASVLHGGRELLGRHGLGDEPLRDLEAIVDLLAAFGADLDRVRLDLGLSRGLQYYTGMVFEIDHAGLGAESQLCGGGRYDELIRVLGGRQPVPALGFAFGLERVKLALEAEGQVLDTEPDAGAFVVAAAPAQAGYAARVAQALRAAGLSVHQEVAQRPLRASLEFAHREGFPHVVVVGEAEALTETFRLREMARGTERVVALASAADVGRPLQSVEVTRG